MPEHTHADGSACDVAHGEVEGALEVDRALVVVYATPLAGHLLTWARELGFRTVLLEPDADRVTADQRSATDVVHHDPADVPVAAHTDVVGSHPPPHDLGPVLAPLVMATPRWVGIIGSPRHAGPHGPALRAAGVPDDLVTTVRRPIGLDIGSRSPAEIALSVLAGLVAERNGREGGPHRSTPTTA